MDAPYLILDEPAVSVVLATHNNAQTLTAAIDSILSQTFQDLELILVDDGSTDETPAIVAAASGRNARVRVIRNDRRLGLSRSLNRGLEMARGHVVARMDGDDVSHPERLAQQIAFLEGHPEVGLLGTQPRFIDGTGLPVPRVGWTVPTEHDAIAWSLLDGNPFVHPSVVVRTDLLRAAGGYDPDLDRGQDMDLWTRLIFTTRCANLPVRLIDYRVPARRFAEWQATMEPRIERVSHRYMERILERPVDAGLVHLIVQLGRAGLPAGTPPDRLIEASLLLPELLEAMGRRGIVEQTGAGPAVERMQDQISRLVSTLHTTRRPLDRVRRRMERTAFSIVIATYRRPEPLPAALASVLAQEYPPDRFEVIVVDNAADEGAAQIVRDVAQESPIAVRSVTEPQNGCSAARNRGAAEARFDYVAFLDDDATAVPTWLAAFDAVIREQHAMVAGGRIVPTIPDGENPPAWFRSPYIQAHFGANHSAMAGSEAVRLSASNVIAIGGGNSVYARRLFDRFGGFPTAHGRTATRLRASEETSLNVILERRGIPIYLTAAARIDHLVDRDRLTKAHLRSRSFWRGVSIGEIQMQLEGRRSLTGQLAAAARSLPSLAWTWLRASGEEKRFPQECQLRDRIGVLVGLVDGTFRRNPLPADIEWGPRDWLTEVERWPEGIDKQRRLYELYRELGDEPSAQAALDRIVASLPGVDDVMPPAAPARE
jgi:glycosyltransferase involved in cell wall biosynthesis